MRTGRVVFFAVAIVAGGCSVIFDTEDYRKGPEVAPPPTEPTVAVMPTSPTTVDDLVASITTESTSTAGPVTYRFDWTCTPDCGTATGASVPAASTTRGQTWTVSVTPIATDDVEGTPGTAAVTVMNTAPTLGYAGLQQYDVWLDDTVRAFTGAMADADGDTIAVQYRWTKNDVVQSSVVDRLNLVGLGVAPGDEIEVTVTVSDADVGGSVTVGPAIVRADGGWKPLEPSMVSERIPMPIFADPENDRLLVWRDGALWEYRPAGSDRGWARLNVEMPLQTLMGTRVIHDAAHHRFLVFGGYVPTGPSPGVTNDLYEIAVPQRGSETVRLVPPGAERPSPRMFSAALVDVERDRALVYGGTVPSPNFMGFSASYDDLWTLDLSATDPVFALVGTGMAPGEIVGPAVAVDAATDSAYFIGGAILSGAFALTDDVYRLDLATTTFEPQQVATLPVVRYLANAVTGADGTGAFIVGGSDSSSGYTGAPPLRFDFATRAFTPLNLASIEDPPLDPVIRSSSDPAAYVRDDGHLVLVSNANADGAFETYDIDVAASTAARLSALGVTTLASMGGRSVVEQGPFGRAIVVFGRGDAGTASPNTAFTWSNGRWSPVTSLATPDFARSDALNVFMPENANNALFGGIDYDGTGGNVAKREFIRMTGSPATWIAASVEPASPPTGFPTSITDGMAWDATCGRGFYSAAGDSVWSLTGMSTYTRAVVSASRPNPLFQSHYVGLTAGSNHRIVRFGGASGGNVVTDPWLIDVCNALPVGAPDEGFIQPSSSGTIPAARIWGSLVAAIAGTTSPKAILFGGADGTNNTATRFNDASLLTLTTMDNLVWASLPTGEDVPLARAKHLAFWDRFNSRMIVFGGLGNSLMGDPTSDRWLTDTWEYRLPAGF